MIFKKWSIGEIGIVLSLLVFMMMEIRCSSPDPEPVAYVLEERDGSVVEESLRRGTMPPSEEELPPLEEQEVMDRQISYCQKKFGPGQDSRYACITGYLAQPIRNSLNDFDE